MSNTTLALLGCLLVADAGKTVTHKAEPGKWCYFSERLAAFACSSLCSPTSRSGGGIFQKRDGVAESVFTSSPAFHRYHRRFLAC
jgi:hypothetical protein